MRSRSSLPSLAAAVVVALLAWRTGAIFEGGERPAAVLWPPVVAALLVVVLPHRHEVRLGLQAVAAVVATVVAIDAAGGSIPGDVGTVIARGLASNLASPWPVPATASNAGGVVLVVAVVAALSVELAARRAPGPLVLVPPSALAGLLAVLSAPAGAPPASWLVGVAAGFVAVLRLVEVDRRRHRALRSPVGATRRRTTRPVVLAIGAAALVVAGATSGALAGVDRWNPRDEIELPTRRDNDLSPLSRVDGWRRLQPAEVMFRIDPAPPSDRPWRLVALTRYDGQSWMPSADYRPAGRELRSVPDRLPLQSATVQLEALRLPWLPAPDGVVSVSEPVATDAAVGGLLWDGTPPAGLTYQVNATATEPALTAQDAPPAGEILLDVSLPPNLVQLASEFTAGATSDYERALLLAARLRRDYQLDLDAPGGHSLLVLDSFLQRQRPGREEQFVAAYAVLAAALDLPVRVVVGFEPEPAAQGAVARSSAVRAWPEVEFVGAGWIPFDPVPEDSESVSSGGSDEVAADEADPLPAPQTPEPTPPTTVPPPVDGDQTPDAGTGGFAPPAAAVASGLALLLVAGYLAGIVLLKRRRRDKRQQADPDDQVTGAFSTGMETLIDLGAPVRRSATNRELVLAAAPTAPGDVDTLAQLADQATAAVFASEPPDDLEARLAWTRLEEFERSVAASVGRVRWARARLSLRSFRRRL